MSEPSSNSLPTPAIAELSPAAIEEVIKKEAKDLTEADIEGMIAYYRAERARFAQAEREGKRPGQRATRAKAAPDPEIDALLKDLEI